MYCNLVDILHYVIWHSIKNDFIICNYYTFGILISKSNYKESKLKKRPEEIPPINMLNCLTPTYKKPVLHEL